MRFFFAILLTSSFAMTVPANADSIALMLERYRQDGAGPFESDAGKSLWLREFNGRSCATCHGEDVRGKGLHAQTGKEIAPLAPSRNPARLTETPEITKWLLRNCKWTLGRECTAQEKGDLLTWLGQQ